MRDSTPIVAAPAATPPPWLLAVLRVTVATAASLALLLHVTSLGFMGWLWTGGIAGAAGLDERTLLPTAIRVLAWGVGFGVLALAIVWRAGERYAVLVAALFVACYSLWGGVAEALPFRGTAWAPAALIALDSLTHALGVRFTQLFPRPLERADLVGLGPRWARRTALPVLAALLDRRLFWGFAIVLEGGLRLLPSGSPGLYGAHILVWVSMAAVYLYAAYRRGGAADRQRIFWIMEGVMAFVAAQVLFLAIWAVSRAGVPWVSLELWTPWLWAATSWVTLACFYLAVFYFGALDPALVLRRTTVLSASSALAVLIFVTLETAIEGALAGLIGPESDLGALIAGVTAGLTIHPIAVRIDRAVRSRSGSGSPGASRDPSFAHGGDRVPGGSSRRRPGT